MNTEKINMRVKTVLAELTLKEKVSLLSGKDTWSTASVERLGIPSLTMTDGPHGLRNMKIRPFTTSTCFPTGLSMASSWNPELIGKVGAALAEETLAVGFDILLGPCVNIVRHPLSGRTFESYSEDPHLAGRIGVAYVKGAQSRGVGTALKHFACNNQEKERLRVSAEVDERTLREIYLPAFEAVVKEANPWTVMCAYNRINGIFGSQNRHLLTEILREEWGYEGVVVSDWTANHSTVESMEAGLDLEMPGPAKYYGDLLVDAVHKWQIDEAMIDRAASRMLRMIVRSGKMNKSTRTAGALNTPEHQALALELARESITLLKNDNGVLPVRADSTGTIAVIGPNADEAVIQGQGSSYVDAPYKTTPWEALKSSIGDPARVRYEKGCANDAEWMEIRPEFLLPVEGEGNGLTGAYFDNADFSGEPALTRRDQYLDFHWWVGEKSCIPVGGRVFSARWTGTVQVPETGGYAFTLVNSGDCRLYLDGELVFRNTGLDSVAANSSGEIHLEAGKAHAIKIEYVKPPDVKKPYLRVMFGYSPDWGSVLIHRAVEVAREAETALVFVGYADNNESEGRDRTHMRLPGRQDELIERIAGANPNTVVVLTAGSPVEMPWIDKVAAVVDGFYSGQESGNAIADILLGKVNPSGKLAVTFPKHLQDTPAFLNYPGDREVIYGEELYVGYRYYDTKCVEPLFPFGHGLSYTQFDYGALKAPERFRAGEKLTVSLNVKNVGPGRGKEVVQLYVSDLEAGVGRPLKELKAFAKISLDPGEDRTVAFELDDRAFSYYDVKRKQWVAEPGEFELLAGSSSRDIRSRTLVSLTD